jgi:hypothetical protein
MSKPQINIMFTYSDLLSPSPCPYILFLHHVSIFLQGPGSVAELIFYAQGLDQSRRTRGLSFGWSHRLIVGLCRQLTGRTVRLSLLLDVYFAADLLVGLPGARFFANQLVGLFIASSSRWGSPAKLGTPRRLNYLSLY